MPKLIDEVLKAVKRLRDTGMIVEQRMAECLDIADRAYILRTGRLLMQGALYGRHEGQSGRAEGTMGIVRVRESGLVSPWMLQ